MKIRGGMGWGEERQFQEKYGPGWSWMPAWMVGPKPNMVGSGVEN